MKTIALPSGEAVPVLGLGTWRMGERAGKRSGEVEALRAGLDLGMTLIDTAEMYGEGGAEEVVGEAIAGRRDEVFIVSKVYPHNASRDGAVAACGRSLQRLRAERIDLYLLHWPGSIPLEETLEAFARLVDDGKIRYYGVSNFDTAGMQALCKLAGGEAIATNQVIYNLTRRGIEWDLLPWSAGRMPVMAYSPLEQGRKMGGSVLPRIAQRHGVTPLQVALAWVLQRGNIIAIPKASDIEHVRQNHAALDITLESEDLAELDDVFPPPTGPTPLEML